MYPSKPNRVPGNARATPERAQELVGERGKPTGRAVTFAQAGEQGLVELQSTLVTAAPTMDQHNALVKDVRALAAILNRLGATITGL